MSTSSLPFFFFFSSRRRHTKSTRDWSSDVCSSDLSERRKGRFYRPFLRSDPYLTGPDQAIPHLNEPYRTVLHQTEPHQTRSEERRVGKECRSRSVPRR